MYLSGSLEKAFSFDHEIAALAEKEEKRQLETINLIVSENYVSPVAAGLEGSIFADKNAQGYPNSRTVGGCEIVNEMESLACDRFKELFGVEHVNVQSLSATISNMAVFRGLLNYGDTVLSLGIDLGGHISHGASYHYSGELFNIVNYGFSRDTETIDMDQVMCLAKKHMPKLIICGSGAYPRLVDYKGFKKIADEVGAILLADIAHPSGLIAAGVIPSPVPYADIITSTTHKTLRGSRGGGLIMCKSKYAQQIDNAVSPGLQGAPKMDMIAARAVQAKECMTPEYKEYQAQTLNNSLALADALMKEGFRLVSGGTDTHLILVDIHGWVSSGKEADRVLSSVGIVVNKELLPFDDTDPSLTSGVRIGTPALTTRGFTEEDFKEVAHLFAEALRNHDDVEKLSRIRAEVKNKALQYPLFNPRWDVSLN